MWVGNEILEMNTYQRVEKRYALQHLGALRAYPLIPGNYKSSQFRLIKDTGQKIIQNTWQSNLLFKRLCFSPPPSSIFSVTAASPDGCA